MKKTRSRRKKEWYSGDIVKGVKSPFDLNKWEEGQIFNVDLP
jgi:hypothetical protein